MKLNESMKKLSETNKVKLGEAKRKGKKDNKKRKSKKLVEIKRNKK